MANALEATWEGTRFDFLFCRLDVWRRLESQLLPVTIFCRQWGEVGSRGVCSERSKDWNGGTMRSAGHELEDVLSRTNSTISATGWCPTCDSDRVTERGSRGHLSPSGHRAVSQLNSTECSLEASWR